MKILKSQEFINEKLQINPVDLDSFQEYNYFPKTKDELKSIINERISKEGNNCDLNDIDTSKITDMSELFFKSKFNEFNGDISNWDVSNVIYMNGMFSYSKFNGDISNWNVSNVTNMNSMFESSEFNGDISHWNVSNVTDMSWMFYYSKFNGDISNWDVSNVTGMSYMFYNSKFNGDISKWDVYNVTNYYNIFKYCLLETQLEKQPKFK